MEKNGRKFFVVNIPGEGYVRTFHFDETLTPLYILKTRHALLYSGYRLISKELSLIHEVLRELADPKVKPEIVIQSLSFTAIITYGKCFSQAEGRKVKLNEKSVLKDASDDLHSLHNDILIMRNNYIAHGGVGDYEKNPVCGASKSKNKNN